MVGSRTANLTPDPSFAHNLGDRCPNGQCQAIFDIYASRPFQRHQTHPNARCFGPFCRTLNIRESRRTPNPHFFQVLGFTPTLGQSRVATLSPTRRKRSMSSLTLRIFFHTIAITFFWILGHFANFVARAYFKLTYASPSFQHFLDKSKKVFSGTLHFCFVKRLTSLIDKAPHLGGIFSFLPLMRNLSQVYLT